MKKLLVATATIAALATPALAADMAPRYAKAPPMMQEVYNWTGFYIGAQVGGAWSDYRYDNISLTSEPISHNANSIAGGGHVGYNWQFSNIVLGVEAEFNGTDLNGSSTMPLMLRHLLLQDGLVRNGGGTPRRRL